MGASDQGRRVQGGGGGLTARPIDPSSPARRVARVLPDVTGLDKAFDYTVPAELVDRLVPGSIVRVPLHGRRVRGWVLELDPPDAVVDAARLRPIAMFSSLGPERPLVELAGWASVRWAAGRLRPFLVAASPPRNVAGLPPPAHRTSETSDEDVSQLAVEVLAAGGGVVRLPPNDDVTAVVLACCRRGPTLVVVPSAEGAASMARRLRVRGARVAAMPTEWAQAAAGVDVVIGARAAAWAPCPGLAAAVVVDEHDEGLQEERAPTWHARDVVVERARRAGAPVVLTSPAPTVVGLHALGGLVVEPAIEDERASWPIVEVVDRSRDEPWKTSLLTSPLITYLRDQRRTVVCVHNTPGRARILACRNCRSLARCERCAAAVGLSDVGRLHCRRCGLDRPVVCAVCGAGAFANLRPGVTRLREELEAAAGRPVVSVTGGDDEPPAPADVYVGTEAALHRIAGADVVAFLDFDNELLAPRYRADEQAMALLVRGARLLGPRAAGGRLLVQTFVPRHEVVQAALLADPGRLVEPELARRRLLRLPPFAALATVSGSGSDDVAHALRDTPDVEVGGTAGDHVARAADWETLGRAIIAARRPKGSRVRVVVDPPRH